jgi:hypothetical protein
VKANIGDWLVVKRGADNRHGQRGVITAVRPGGVPPYTVRWMEDDLETIVFPSPDAEIVSPTRLVELDRLQVEQIARAQAAITTAPITARRFNSDVDVNADDHRDPN